VPAPRPNRLLAAFGDRELSLRAHRLREVELKPRGVLFERGDVVDRVHFPQTAILAQQVVDYHGRPVAAATIGNEGVVGVGACLGGGPALMRVVVLVPGVALSLDRATFVEAVNASGSMRDLLGGYGDASACESLQLAACMAKHSVEERLARCLLHCLDGRQTTELEMAEDVLSIVLGVRQSGLTVAARTLQGLGFLEYRRGTYRVIDRALLEEFACQCYDVIRAKYQRLGSAVA